MTDENPPGQPHQLYSAVVPDRLAPEADPLEGVDQQGSDEALEWQALSGPAAPWTEFAAVANRKDPQIANRWWEMHLLMAATGEVLGLAWAAGVEVEAWRRKLAEAPEVRGDQIEEGMAMRAMAELQSYYVLGAGHRLATITAKLLMGDPHCHEILTTKTKRTYPPFSDAPQDWPSLTKKELRHFRVAARASKSQAVRGAVETISALEQSIDWKALGDRRNRDFHRWRTQSPGIVTYPVPSTPWTVSDQGKATLNISFPRTLGDPEDLRRFTEIVGAGFASLVSAMSEYREQWKTASHDLLGSSRVQRASGEKPKT